MSQAADPQSVLGELAAPIRLAVAYAPGPAKPAWTALLALDERLGRVALGAREPLVAQLRLAWWRDRFREPAERWPGGEPLLALLRRWDGERPALAALVDGWERMVGGDADAADVAALVDARVGAMAALARLVEAADEAAIRHVARRWADADLARRLGRPAPPPAGLRPLPRAMRPLAVLAALADDEGGGWRGWLRVVRLGMFGR